MRDLACNVENVTSALVNSRLNIASACMMTPSRRKMLPAWLRRSARALVTLRTLPGDLSKSRGTKSRQETLFWNSCSLWPSRQETQEVSLGLQWDTARGSVSLNQLLTFCRKCSFCWLQATEVAGRATLYRSLLKRVHQPPHQLHLTLLSAAATCKAELQRSHCGKLHVVETRSKFEESAAA